MPEQKVDFRRGLSSTIPSEIVPGTILIETDTGNMYVDDTETSRVQIKDSTKLPLIGGYLTGPLSLGGNVISNVGTPVADTDAVNKRYVDVEFQAIESEFATALKSYLQLKGGTMQGSLDMGGFSLTNLEAPVNASDAATKQYVDEHSSSGGADESVYTTNGIKILPSNQPFNIGAHSGATGSEGYRVNELYCNSGWFEDVTVNGSLISKNSSIDNIVPTTSKNTTLSIQQNNISIGSNASISTSTSFTLTAGDYTLTLGNGALTPGEVVYSLGSDTFPFDSFYTGTVYTQKLSPIPGSPSSVLDLSNYTAIDLGDRPFVEISSTTSSGMPSLDIGSSTRRPDEGFEFVSVYSDKSIDLYCGLGTESPGVGGLELSVDSNGVVSFFSLMYLSVTNLGTPTYRYSTVYCESVSESSDADSKSDIHYLDSNNGVSVLSTEQGSQITTQDVINFVKNLDPATFIYKRDGVSTVEQAMSEDPDIIHLGIIANDIEDDPLFNYVASKVTSTVKDETEGEIEKTVYSIKPASLAVAALTACKYLIQEVESLKSQLN